MADPFVGEIKMFAGNFAPRTYALCNGQILPVNQNVALFSILGANYGGDGRTTFALPNLQGRSPMQQGQGTGLTPRTLGEAGGSSGVTLTTETMPSHTHGLGSNSAPSTNSPGGATFSGNPRANTAYYASAGNAVLMNQSAIQPVGGGQAHNNLQPFQALTFIIALIGVFPQRP